MPASAYSNHLDASFAAPTVSHQLVLQPHYYYCGNSDPGLFWCAGRMRLIGWGRVSGGAFMLGTADTVAGDTGGWETHCFYEFGQLIILRFCVIELGPQFAVFSFKLLNFGLEHDLSGLYRLYTLEQTVSCVERSWIEEGRIRHDLKRQTPTYLVSSPVHSTWEGAVYHAGWYVDGAFGVAASVW